MNPDQPTWRLTPVTFYTAVCPHCLADLLVGGDYAAWAQPEGVEAAVEDLDWCPECDEPISERGYDAQEEES